MESATQPGPSAEDAKNLLDDPLTCDPLRGDTNSETKHGEPAIQLFVKDFGLIRGRGHDESSKSFKCKELLSTLGVSLFTSHRARSPSTALAGDSAQGLYRHGDSALMGPVQSSDSTRSTPDTDG